MAVTSARAPAAAISPHAFRRMRALRNFEDMFLIGDALNQRAPAEVVLRAIARTQAELGHDGEALQAWKRLHELLPYDLEAAEKIARHDHRMGMGAEHAARRALPASSDLARRVVSEAIEQNAFASVEDGDLHHIAICGVSFCGSTLLDRILGGLPGARSIGESHWLTKEHNGAAYVPMDLSLPRSGRGPFCTACGPSCPVLTMEFRTALALDSLRWYHKIAHRQGCSTLISADKNLPKLVDNDPLLRFTALVMFKTPAQAWASHLSHLAVGHTPAFYSAELEKYSGVWANAYKGFLDDFEPQGGKVFLNFDEFAERPEAGLSALAAHLRLADDQSVLIETRPGHAIGGNRGTMQQLRGGKNQLKINALPPPRIADDHLGWLNASGMVQETFARLQARRITF